MQTEIEMAALWNAQSDEINQWHSLGVDEMLMWAQKQAAHICVGKCLSIATQAAKAKRHGVSIGAMDCVHALREIYAQPQ